jgi:hypothetical protein
MGNASGFVFATLICQGCADPFAVAASTGKAVAKLTDPFEAECPHCGNQSTYPKSAIQILAVGQEGEAL